MEDMASGSLAQVLGFLRRLAPSATVLAQADELLLRRFAEEGDEAAFTVLVQRHGPLVLGVCRRLLRRGQDVEDAFQATFLVLARKAGALGRPERLSGYLYGVAVRIARRLRHQVDRLGLLDAPELIAAPEQALADETDLRDVLDEELERLPEKYRAPIVLCCLQGLSRDDAARQLGWSPTVLKGLLERGRQQLRRRLQRRGVLTAVLPPVLALESLSPRLADDAVQTSVAFAAGRAVAAPVTALAEGVLQAMNLLRWQMIVGLGLLVLTFAGLGLAVQPPGDNPPAPAAVPADPHPEPARRPFTELKHKGSVNALVWSRDGRQLYTAGADGVVRIWDVARGRMAAQMKGHGKPVRTLVLSPDGQRLASAGEGKTVRVWDVAKRESLATISLDEDGVHGLAFSPDGKLLVGVRNTNRVLRWDAETGQARGVWRVGQMKEGLRSVVFSPDGKQLVVGAEATYNEGTRDIAFHTVDATTGKELFQALRLRSKEPPRAKQKKRIERRAPLAYSPDGSTWVGGWSDEVLVLGPKGTVETEHATTVETEHETITAVLFLPNGKTVVSAGREGGINFVSVGELEFVARLTNQGQVLALAVSPSGQRLAWARADGVVRIGNVATILARHKVKKKDR
jgi:RNA polymerase sigma factor (sigma-70 family)